MRDRSCFDGDGANAAAGVFGSGADAPAQRPGQLESHRLLVTPDMPGFEVVEARMPNAVFAARPRLDWHFTIWPCPRKTSWGKSARA